MHKSAQHEERALRTTLQAVAVSVFIGKLYTVCSLYLPHHAIQSNEIEDLINQLPRPYIIQGDFNARSFLWGDTIENARGRIIEEIALSNDITIMNNGQPTRYHSQTGTSSVMDYTLCSSDCHLDFEYSVGNSLFGSDHYPVELKIIKQKEDVTFLSTFSTDRAD